MGRADPYVLAGRELLADTGCTVARWRTTMSGSADVASPCWAIEAPRPRGPISFGVFAHEVAHQVLHRSTSKPRWQQEVEAEEWALAQFDRLGLPGRDRYEAHAAAHVARAFDKALRRHASSPARRGGLAARIRVTCPGWWARSKVFS